MKQFISIRFKYGKLWISLLLLNLISGAIHAQQFNSDSYLTMPHGIATIIVTSGERNETMYLAFALLPRFELNVTTSLFWDNSSEFQTNRFTTNIFGKYMFWVNKQNNGGAAATLGIGKSPGYFTESAYSAFHQNYWTAFPVTFPLFNNTLSWDIMPGALVDFDHGNDKQAAWGFTYSSRLAIYKVIPKTAIVGEIYGTEGQVYSKAEFRAGLRWEPNSWIVAAATYGAAIDGTKASGFELGVMIFTPQFLRKDFIKNNSIIFNEN